MDTLFWVLIILGGLLVTIPVIMIWIMGGSSLMPYGAISMGLGVLIMVGAYLYSIRDTFFSSKKRPTSSMGGEYFYY